MPNTGTWRVPDRSETLIRAIFHAYLVNDIIYRLTRLDFAKSVSTEAPMQSVTTHPPNMYANPPTTDTECDDRGSGTVENLVHLSSRWDMLTRVGCSGVLVKSHGEERTELIYDWNDRLPHMRRYLPNSVKSEHPENGTGPYDDPCSSTHEPFEPSHQTMRLDTAEPL